MHFFPPLLHIVICLLFFVVVFFLCFFADIPLFGWVVSRLRKREKDVSLSQFVLTHRDAQVGKRCQTTKRGWNKFVAWWGLIQERDDEWKRVESSRSKEMRRTDVPLFVFKIYGRKKLNLSNWIGKSSLVFYTCYICISNRYTHIYPWYLSPNDHRR